MVISMERWKGKVAVVTGASSGIGAAIAEKLVKAGLQVVGVARRKHLIENHAKNLNGKGEKLYALRVDITKEEDILAAFEWIKQNLGSIHILINCAGIYRLSSLSAGKTEMWREVFEVMVLGLCITTREAIKNMEANNVAGHIVHINSIGGHKVIDPRGSVCSAAKFALTGLTETLRQEFNLSGSKIKVSSVSPGVVVTNIYEATEKASGSKLSDRVKEMIRNGPRLQAEDVADAILYILATPSHVQVHELIIKPIGELY